jgi:GMP synthase-like glutamine amidotransferase
MTNCLVVQHVAAEPGYALGDALERSGVALDVRRVDEGDPVPLASTSYDGIVVMGGPMSASSAVDFPSRRAELSLLADALRTGVPTLGVCLGAQLLAIAAGGSVRRGESGPEIGWAPIVLTAEAAEDPILAGLPRHLEVLHWHGDAYELPPGSTHLAGSARYRNQAFRTGPSAWGLQFHLEVTVAAVDAFVTSFGDEAVDAPGGPAAIRRATPQALDVLRPWRVLVFDRFAALVSQTEPDGSRGCFADISAP